MDIGANVGQFYSECKEVYPDANYHLVEGNPMCENKLKELGVNYSIELLSDDVKEVQFWMRTDDPFATGNSIYKENTDFYKNSLPVKRQTKTLDFMFNDKKFDFIKIDTQGSEIDILRGGERLVSSAKGILLEVSYTEYNSGSPLKDEVIEYMNSIGFKQVEILNKIHHPTTGEHIQDDILFIKNNLINE